MQPYPHNRKYKRNCESRSDSDRLICSRCSNHNWSQLNSDFWRLDKWLEVVEGTQSEQHSAPSDLEMLEDAIQRHCKFLLEHDSHKSIVEHINIISVEHVEDTTRAEELRDRLAVTNARWDKISTAAAQWQRQLQVALRTNQQFYRNIEELSVWVERTEVSLRTSEPIDLAESDDVIETKYDQYR